MAYLSTEHARMNVEDGRQLSLPLPIGGFGAGWYRLPLAAFAVRTASPDPMRSGE